MIPELLILDCDGVLIDSEVISAKVLVEVAAEAGVAFDAAHVRDNFLGRSFPTVLKGIEAEAGRPMPEGFEAAYRGRLLERFERELRPMPGIMGLLDRLAVPACVATSSSPARAARSLAIAGLDGRLPRVFTASMVARGKPAPDLFLLAAREMGVAPGRCLVVEDSRPGVIAARAAGMAVALFAGGSHYAGLDEGALRRLFDSEPLPPPFWRWEDLAAAFPILLPSPCETRP
ncbi:HAD family hydrolase [Rubellimicrobium aerolatum]|uniref:HAD family hydrolase n=1 Tax=Rubellimicrobium aerolatum TaxID=490979 RepID=A0ABW0S7V3_9RHOB|nr:HAD-IA family hydrolase [Rubellimicrobium aerolatum]MBP1804453.1 HAD superfamily hydrolase (TIGR01509 family) [Rubellimicrobium aerolatum]